MSRAQVEGSGSSDTAGIRISFGDLERFTDRYSLGYERGEGSQHFLRVKVPNGMMSTEQFKDLAEMAEEYGRGYAEVTDRQDIQLHWIDGEDAVKIFTKLEHIGFNTDRCGQAYPGARYGDVRNVVGCPVAGVDKDEVFDASRIVRDVTNFFTGNRAYMDLPRKFKISISGCAINCASPQIQDLAFAAVRHRDGRMGFTVFAGGGVGIGPRLADHMGVFVEPRDVLDVARSFVELYRDHGQREAKAKARFKWLVQAWGIAKLRSMVEQKLGRHLDDYRALFSTESWEHIGVKPQKQNGYSYVSVPLLGGILSSRIMLRLTEIAERYGWHEIRLTNYQNLILVGIKESKISEVIDELRQAGFDCQASPLMWTTIACAGNFCGKAPENVKARAVKIVEHLGARFGEALREVAVTVAVSGCPNGCSRHLVSDVGLQAVEVRKSGYTIPAYNLYLRDVPEGDRPLATLVMRGIDADKIQFALERMIAACLKEESQSKSFRSFIHRRSIEYFSSLVDSEEGLKAND